MLVKLLVGLLSVGMAFAQHSKTPNRTEGTARTVRSSTAALTDSDFDIRGLDSFHNWPNSDPGAKKQERALLRHRSIAVQEYRAAADSGERADLRIEVNSFGLPRRVSSSAGALSTPSDTAPEQIARDYLRKNRGIFFLDDRDLDGLRLVGKDVSGRFVHLDFIQSVNGIGVFGGSVHIALNREGEIIQAGVGKLLPGFELPKGAAKLNHEEAVRAAFRTQNLDPPGALTALPPDREYRVVFANPIGSQYSPIWVEPVIFPISATDGKLAYRIFLEAGKTAWYELLIDADEGGLFYRRSLRSSAAQARVWKVSPLEGQRELVDFPEGWLPANGTVTTGNNVDAYLDGDSDNKPDVTSSPDLRDGRARSASQVFDFPAGEGSTGQDPRGFQAAAVTNLFYLTNQAHDYFYGLGFTEASGNFQTNNFARGGYGKDAVRAEAHESSSRFWLTPDGMAPRMEVEIADQGNEEPSDDRDTAYEAQAVIHEYAHGVASRIVGGPDDTSCLGGIQSEALAEGWSDYFSCSYTNDPVQGTYLNQDETRGIRRHSYEGYEYTYEDLGNQGFQEHRDGEIWAATLWDLRKEFGAAVTDQLVMDSLKLMPCDPSMIEARDAMLLADQTAHGKSNRRTLWELFARHGMGHSASGRDSQVLEGTVFTAAYDLPPDLQPGNHSPTASSTPGLAEGMGKLYMYDVNAEDIDGDTLTYELVDPPPRMTIDSKTGLIQWTADFNETRAQVKISDGKGGEVIHGFSIPVLTILNPGSRLTISGLQDSTGYAGFILPGDAQLVQITLRGGSGDPDLAVLTPGLGWIDSFRTGTDETITVRSARAGIWIILVDGFEAYSGVSLSVRILKPGTLDGNTTTGGVSGDRSSESFYKVEVPAGMAIFRVSTSGGSGDVDLFVSKDEAGVCPGEQVTLDCEFDYSSAKTGNTEVVDIRAPAAGTWYVTLFGSDSYSDVAVQTEVLAAVPASPAIALSETELDFSFTVGGDPPAAQRVDIQNSGGGTLHWTATANVAWLKVSPTTGAAPFTISITADPNGLGAGTFTGKVQLSSPGLPPKVITVVLSVDGAPNAPLITSVVNAASFQDGFASCGWVTIQGLNLAGTTRIWRADEIVAGLLPTALDGVSVKINNRAAFVYFISPTQLNVQAPLDKIEADLIVEVEVTTPEGVTRTDALLRRFSPGLFMFEPDGSRYVAALHADGTLAGRENLISGLLSRPVRPRDTIVLYTTGLGWSTDPEVPAGQVVTSPAALVDEVAVTIGGRPAQVAYAGLVAAGLYQLNVVVPEVPDGDQLVLVVIGGISSPDRSFVTVQK